MRGTFDDSPYRDIHDGAPHIRSSDEREIDRQEFRELLDASAYARGPICILGSEAAGQWAEVYESASTAVPAPNRFLVRLVMRDEAQYLVVLSDLPGLFAHLEHLVALLGPLPIASPVPTARSARRRH